MKVFVVQCRVQTVSGHWHDDGQRDHHRSPPPGPHAVTAPIDMDLFQVKFVRIRLRRLMIVDYVWKGGGVCGAATSANESPCAVGVFSHGKALITGPPGE